MKRIILLGIACLLLTVPAHATQVFWDQSPPADPVITDSDFKYDYSSDPRSTAGQPQIYDSGEILEVEPLSDEDAAPRQVRPRTERSTVETPRRTEPPAVREPSSRRTRTVAPRRPEPAGTRVEPTVEPVRPGPKSDTPEPQIKRGTPVPASGQEEVKPEQKKLPWGREGAKPSAGQTQSKFQWGQDR